ncbi:hypothetical protein E2C01_046011 [Portunus trituberculatus]|uniref:Uncharacterized protein n=1 Tax=Portunus trituberculatus TaxID=210409 RepID=A0A5B7G4M6_PORTR|nr:hypothetical protein [Portunus trituberculatus]
MLECVTLRRTTQSTLFVLLRRHEAELPRVLITEADPGCHHLTQAARGVSSVGRAETRWNHMTLALSSSGRFFWVEDEKSDVRAEAVMVVVVVVTAAAPSSPILHTYAKPDLPVTVPVEPSVKYVAVLRYGFKMSPFRTCYFHTFENFSTLWISAPPLVVRRYGGAEVRTEVRKCLALVPR